MNTLLNHIHISCCTFPRCMVPLASKGQCSIRNQQNGQREVVGGYQLRGCWWGQCSRASKWVENIRWQRERASPLLCPKCLVLRLDYEAISLHQQYAKDEYWGSRSASYRGFVALFSMNEKGKLLPELRRNLIARNQSSTTLPLLCREWNLAYKLVLPID